MPKFLIEGSFSAESVLDVTDEKSSGQQARVKEALGAVGGSLEGLYYAIGATNVYILCDCPDYVGESVVSLAVLASGFVQTKTTPLLKAGEPDRSFLTGS